MSINFGEGKFVKAITIGCKVNSYDTQVVLQKFIDNGYQIADNITESIIDVLVVNTCCVTDNAEHKSRKAIRQAKSKGAVVAAMGCACQTNPAKFHEIGADIVVGTSGRDDIPQLVENFFKNDAKITQTPSATVFEDAFVKNVDDRTRAFLKIQDGCNNFCTYCIVPYVRGRSRSRPFVDVVTQAHHFAAVGFKEIVISGIHVASYGKDFERENFCLLDVLAQICKIDEIKRVRLSSVEPNAITPEFIAFVADNPKFCSHLHMSLQSGNDRILQAMGRHYTTAGYAAAVADLRKIRPDISITTDVIVGFPGETDDEFKNTLNFIESLKLSGLHVFPYSAKAGTPAAKMPGHIVGKIKKERAKQAVLLGKRLADEFCGRFIDKTMGVLVEKCNSAICEGKTENYLTAIFKSEEELSVINQIVDVRMKSYNNGNMAGEAVKY